MYKINLPVLFGLESVVRDELFDLGFVKENVELGNGNVQISLKQDRDSIAKAVALCNVHLRCAERVELVVAEFQANDFDQLFDNVKALEWDIWIPENAAFTVDRSNTHKSNLFAPAAIQSTIKKAIVLSLIESRNLNENSRLKEDRNFLDLHIAYEIIDNNVRLSFNTSGAGLHKRGYRLDRNQAPISETLAAGIIKLSQYSPENNEVVYDVCCGSGTFPIEAAMIAYKIAPGARRDFTAEKWPFIGDKIFTEVKNTAIKKEIPRGEIDPENIRFAGSDIDGKSISMAKANARRAGVREVIDFRVLDLHDLRIDKLNKYFKNDKFLFLANPPYGERMADEAEVIKINQGIANLVFYPKTNFTNPGVRLSIITASDFEKDTGHKADKRRKLYNGMIRSTMYHYFRQKYV